MKTRGLLERIDDWLNPIVVKELRQAVRSRMVVSSLMFFLLLQLITLGAALIFGDDRGASGGPRQINFYAGRTIFLVLQGLLLGTCLLLIPSYASVRLASERSETNVDLLFISTLRPYNIIAGKMGVSFVLSLLVFSACAPFMTFTYLMRGIDIPTILIVLVFDLLVVLTGTQLAIFQASIPANRAFRAVLGLGSVGILIYGLVGSITLTYFMVEMGVGLFLDSWWFWGPALTVVVLLLSTIALLFSWSVALVSPPSANRALAGRLCIVGVWLATAGVATLWCVKNRSIIPVYFWISGILTLLALQMAISINERESWGTRIRRFIPRRVWLRPFAFLVYSGSAGGVLFAVLFMGLSLGGMLLAHSLQEQGYLHSFFRDVFTDAFKGASLCCLYVFCYCLTAVLCSRLLLGGRIAIGHTWIVVLVLMGFGIFIPYLLRFLLVRDAFTADEYNWLLLPNPFHSIGLALEPPGRYSSSDVSHETLTWIFLAVWSAVAILLALPWFLRQVRGFRPSEPSAIVSVE